MLCCFIDGVDFQQGNKGTKFSIEPIRINKKEWFTVGKITVYHDYFSTKNFQGKSTSWNKSDYVTSKLFGQYYI